MPEQAISVREHSCVDIAIVLEPVLVCSGIVQAAVPPE